MINRGLRYKLYPDTQTEITFRQYSGVCRLVYNLALEQRRTWGQRHRLGTSQQCRELTKLRAAFDFIGDVHVTPQQQALRDLHRAYVNFFEGRADYPTPRKRGVDDRFRFQGRELVVEQLNGKWSRVRLPKIGWVKFRRTRPLVGKINNATISRDALGWHIAFSVEIRQAIPTHNDRPSVGIDRGVVVTAMTSDGEAYHMPSRLEGLDRQHRRAQRILARRQRGSNRYRKAHTRAARIKAKAARVRMHANHEMTTSLAHRYGAVILEDLNTRGMMASVKGTAEAPGKNVRAKAGLNRSIANQAWFQFEAMLHYKLAERGGHLVKVNPAYTSQTCSHCGVIDADSRESQALFRCRHCGHEHHADLNAAINILRRNTSSMRVEDAGCGACETRSPRYAA